MRQECHITTSMTSKDIMMPKRTRPVRCWEFRFLLLVAATATAAADDEEDDIAHLYSILSECPADPEESPLEFVVEYWSHVGPLLSPLADLAMLLSFLGLTVPLICTAIGAAFVAHFVKETFLLLYLGFRGLHISGEVVGLHTQHWAEHHLARSSGTGGSHIYCRVTVRYRSDHEMGNDNSNSQHGCIRRDFLLQTIPPRRGKVDLLVCRTWPTISRVVEENDTSLLQQLRLTIKLLGLLLLSCIVGGLLLTMIIEIIPPMCQAKQILWVSYFISFLGYTVHLLLTESRHGATSELTNQEEDVVGTQTHRGYEYVPDVDVDASPFSEDAPPTAMPIAEPVANFDVTIPITSAQATRSIFGPRPEDANTLTATATATVID